MAGSEALLARLRAALGRPAGGSSDVDLNPGFRLPEGRRLRPAAVLVGLLPGAGGMQVVLTQRAPRLKHHAGQIALPGGKVDASDADALAAALRETREEIGLDPARVTVLGQLPDHETVTGFVITPFVGLIAPPFMPKPEAGEVAEVFTVPLTHVTDPARFRIERRRWLGQERLYYTVPYGPYYIWGATARILRGLADRMQG